MRDSLRTINVGKAAFRAEIVRAHEIAHDTCIKRRISKRKQRCARARIIEKNHMDGGGIYALLHGRACGVDSYSTHDRTTRITGVAA